MVKTYDPVNLGCLSQGAVPLYRITYTSDRAAEVGEADRVSVESLNQIVFRKIAT